MRSRVIVDVRPLESFLEAHIEGSLHIPDANTKELIEALYVNERLVLVCDDGGVSANVVRMLGVCGYPEVAHLKGGLEAWTEARLPLMRTTPRGDRLIVTSDGPEKASVVGSVLGMLTPRVFYAGLAGAAAVLAVIAMVMH